MSPTKGREGAVFEEEEVSRKATPLKREAGGAASVVVGSPSFDMENKTLSEDGADPDVDEQAVDDLLAEASKPGKTLSLKDMKAAKENAKENAKAKEERRKRDATPQQRYSNHGPYCCCVKPIDRTSEGFDKRRSAMLKSSDASGIVKEINPTYSKDKK